MSAVALMADVYWQGDLVEQRYLARPGSRFQLADYLPRSVSVEAETPLEEARLEAGAVLVTDAEGHDRRLGPGTSFERSVGDVRFVIRCEVHRPAPLSKGRRDPALRRLLGLAAGMHLVVALVLFSVPPDAGRLSLDGFELSEPTLRYLSLPDQARAAKPPMPEDWFTDASQDQGDVDTSERAPTQTRSKSPSSNLASAHRDPEHAKATALSAANAVFAAVFDSGGSAASVLAQEAALGSSAMAALGELRGPSGDESPFGAAPGPGTFGDSPTSLGIGDYLTSCPGCPPSLGSNDRGGDRPGRPRLRTGEAGTRVPRELVVPGKPVVSDGLDMELVRRVIRQHVAETRACYERALQTRNDLEGKVSIKFTISGQGEVIAATLEENTMGADTVADCLQARIRRWVFPAPAGGGLVIVKYPFLFRRG